MALLIQLVLLACCGLMATKRAALRKSCLEVLPLLTQLARLVGGGATPGFSNAIAPTTQAC
jgi:hypothetical protein